MNVKKPDPIDVYVGSRVRMRRTMLGMSQERLGEEIGVTFQQVQKYEKGANRIGASRLQRIAAVLSVPASFFFQQDNAETLKIEGIGTGEIDAVTEFLNTKEGLALNQAFLKITDEGVRQKFVALVKAIAAVEDMESVIQPKTADITAPLGH